MEDVAGRYRPSSARLVLMGLFTIVAIVAFVLLVDVRRNPDDPWFGVSDAASQGAMTLLLLAFEAIAFAGVLMLLVIRPYSTQTLVAEEWTSTGGVQMGGDGTRLQIGCPGCGTVFEKPLIAVDEPHEQGFRCPNCGRAGRLRMGLHKPVSIRHKTCISCGQDFQAYRDTAECPHCHAPQA